MIQLFEIRNFLEKLRIFLVCWVAGVGGVLHSNVAGAGHQKPFEA
jgi:hypothetical protein